MENVSQQNQESQGKGRKYLILYTDIFGRSLVSMAIAFILYLIFYYYLNLSKYFTIPIVIAMVLFLSPLLNKIKISSWAIPLYDKYTDALALKIVGLLSGRKN